MDSYLQNSEDFIIHFGNQLFGSFIAQSSLARIHYLFICLSDNSFSQNLYIRLFCFFYMNLRIFNLQITDAA